MFQEGDPDDFKEAMTMKPNKRVNDCDKSLNNDRSVYFCNNHDHFSVF